MVADKVPKGAQVGLSSVNPVFGEQSQANENKNNKQENETVTEAYLYIPFFNPLSSLQKPTYTQNAEYTLDSILNCAALLP